MKRQASILISGILIGALCGEARAQVGLDADAVLVLEVQHADRTPVIDGLLGDWSTTRFIPFGQNADHISDRFGLADDGSTEPEGTALTDVDFSGSVALMWDEDWIYMAARVRDNVHDVANPGESLRWWQRDAVTRVSRFAGDFVRPSRKPPA